MGTGASGHHLPGRGNFGSSYFTCAILFGKFVAAGAAFGSPLFCTAVFVLPGRMKTFAQFQDYLNAELSEELAGLEARRSGMRKKKGVLGGLLAALILASWSVHYLGWLPEYIIPVTVVVATPIAYLAYRRLYFDANVPADFKDTVVKKLVEFVDPSLEYLPERHISFDKYMDSQLFLLQPDYFTGDDLIKGSFRGVDVAFSELASSYERLDRVAGTSNTSRFEDEDNLLVNMLRRVRKIGKRARRNPKLKLNRRKWKTLFHGMFLIADCPVELNGKVFILSNRLYKKFGYSGKLLQQHNFLRGQYILPRNIEFRENFVVYADDLLEGEYVLSDGLMERMLALKQHSAADVYISMIEGKIYMAVHMNREIFKINMNQNLTRTEYLKSFYNDLYYMLTLVEVLNPSAFAEEMDFGMPEDDGISEVGDGDGEEIPEGDFF